MKSLNTYISEGGFFKNVNARIVTVNNKDELRKLIEKTINEQGPNCDLNFINTSKITDMNGLFYTSDFNGNISDWDVSNVTNMSCMFYASQFTGDISKWDVSKVKDMSCMFNFSQFNGNISKWSPKKLKYTTDMFDYTKYVKFNKFPSWYKR